MSNFLECRQAVADQAEKDLAVIDAMRPQFVVLYGLGRQFDASRPELLKPLCESYSISISKRGVTDLGQMLPMLEAIENALEVDFDYSWTSSGAEMVCYQARIDGKPGGILSSSPSIRVYAWIAENASCKKVKVGTQPVYELQCA